MSVRFIVTYCLRNLAIVKVNFQSRASPVTRALLRVSRFFRRPKMARAAGRKSSGVPVPFLRRRFQPVTVPPAERVRAWIAQLDADEFQEREAAFQALHSFHTIVEPPLARPSQTNRVSTCGANWNDCSKIWRSKSWAFPPASACGHCVPFACWRPCPGRRPGSTSKSSRTASRKHPRPMPPSLPWSD